MFDSVTAAKQLDIRFHDTLSNRLEPLQPVHKGEVRIYTCGPTVYDFAHIGNFRTFVFQDILRRFLRTAGYRVLQVMNLTDVDDRIIANSAAAETLLSASTPKNISRPSSKICARSISKCPKSSCAPPTTSTTWSRSSNASQKKGFTYPSDGSIYYRIAKFPDYGKLSKIDVSGMKAGARADTDRYEKDDVRDFALWKAPKPGEFFWETPIGPGRPGWHIECAAMSMKYLGETLDIHTGGIDLAFPHHENEIAESEAATGRTFAKMWLHAEHLIIEGEKMSKSLGNFYTLRDLFAKGYKPSSIRFLLLSVPYNRQLNFTMDGLRQAESSVERMRNFVARLKSEKFADGENPEIHERATKAEKDFDTCARGRSQHRRRSRRRL